MDIIIITIGLCFLFWILLSIFCIPRDLVHIYKTMKQIKRRKKITKFIEDKEAGFIVPVILEAAVSVSLGVEMIGQLKERMYWCNETLVFTEWTVNAVTKSNFEKNVGLYQKACYRMEQRFRFFNEADAVAFKLRWL